MEDREIVELFRRKDGAAIDECEKKYGRFCRRIAANILQSQEDAEECANDALLRLWNAIPPESPASLPAYLGRVTRNLALNRVDERRARKRGSGNVEEALTELEDCLPGPGGDMGDALALREAVNGFLSTLRQT